MRYLLFLSPALLCSCLDPDNDELTTREEKKFGSDPNNPDTDGDGLNDYYEFLEGTDPNDPDSDGDGYLDGDEYDLGINPLDSTDFVYQGGWPYQGNKKSFNGPTSPSQTSSEVGELLLRDQLMDQFGDKVDIYDFAGHGRYVAVMISAMWSSPCNQISNVIATNGTGLGSVPQKVLDKEIYWITIMGENLSRERPTKKQLHDFYLDYPAENVPVLADNPDLDYSNLYLQTEYPTILVFDEKLRYVVGPSSEDYYEALNFLDEL